MRLHCTVVLPVEARDVAGKTLEVMVEDVTLADHSAAVLARFRARVTELPQAGHQLGPVDIKVDLPDPKARYNVRATLTSGETLNIGDLTSTQSYPVPHGQDEAVINMLVQFID
jgi:hypothetical protein